MKYLFPKLVSIVFKILIFYIIGILILNLYFFTFSFIVISGLSDTVHSSVEIHNYLPKHDLDAIQRNIDTYTATEDGESVAGQGIPNLNKIVTDVRIIVYQDSDDDIFTDRLKGKKENKCQQGDIIYCGVVYKYHFITPMLWWEWQRPDYDAGKRGSLAFTNDNAKRAETNVIGSDPTQSFFSVGAQDSFDAFINSAVEIDTAGVGQRRGWTEKTDSDGDGVYTYEKNDDGSIKMKFSDRTLLVKPVICRHDYADLSQENTYNGG